MQGKGRGKKESKKPLIRQEKLSSQIMVPDYMKDDTNIDRVRSRSKIKKVKGSSKHLDSH